MARCRPYEWRSAETVSGSPACLRSAFPSDSWASCFHYHYTLHDDIHVVAVSLKRLWKRHTCIFIQILKFLFLQVFTIIST